MKFLYNYCNLILSVKSSKKNIKYLMDAYSNFENKYEINKEIKNILDGIFIYLFASIGLTNLQLE